MRFLTFGEKLGRPECPYLIRWAINFGWSSIRLHHWLSGDDPRYFHDHPWWFITIVIRGGYVDVSAEGEERMSAGMVRIRRPEHRHTVRIDGGGCWTLLLMGPVVRRWGFWVDRKFLKANKFFFSHGPHPCD